MASVTLLYAHGDLPTDYKQTSRLSLNKSSLGQNRFPILNVYMSQANLCTSPRQTEKHSLHKLFWIGGEGMSFRPEFHLRGAFNISLDELPCREWAHFCSDADRAALRMFHSKSNKWLPPTQCFNSFRMRAQEGLLHSRWQRNYPTASNNDQSSFIHRSPAVVWLQRAPKQHNSWRVF